MQRRKTLVKWSLFVGHNYEWFVSYSGVIIFIHIWELELVVLHFSFYISFSLFPTFHILNYLSSDLDWGAQNQLVDGSSNLCNWNYYYTPSIFSLSLALTLYLFPTQFKHFAPINLNTSLAFASLPGLENWFFFTTTKFSSIFRTTDKNKTFFFTSLDEMMKKKKKNWNIEK